ncbi:MAG: GntR family transcriptional regulator [Pseudomonadota bacterium]
MAAPTAVPRIKAAERVAAELRREIATGNLRPGDRLHSERQLQEQFEISRPTLREALRMLESESLIEVTRGQHGGARVKALDIAVVARQVGVCLQLDGVTLQDVWQARMLIEPSAAGLLTEQGSRAAMQEMAANIAAAREAMNNPVEYATLTTRFSLILTEYCGNRTIHVLSMLIQDIVRRQHVDVTVRTYAKEGVDRLRTANIRGREKMLEIVQSGDAAAAEAYWRKHLEVSGEVVFSGYKAQMPIDVAQLPWEAGERDAAKQSQPLLKPII